MERNRLVGFVVRARQLLSDFGRTEGGVRAAGLDAETGCIDTSLVRAWLDERGISYRYLDGSTPMRERKTHVDAFQAGEGELFLISLKAGGLGLNLTAADYVIHLDPWWNPAVEDQASDRAHRIGQQRPVTVYRLVAAGTIEEKIVDLHRHKRQILDPLPPEGSRRLDLAEKLVRDVDRRSHAKSFAAALAFARRARLVTGDPEFRRLENGIAIEWLTR